MQLIGSRASVYHGNAAKTSGGLTRSDLFQDKYGRIRSRRASVSAKRSKNLGSYLLAKGSHSFIPGGRSSRR
jgi:hypothetical protein